MSRLVLIQGKHVALYIDGKQRATFEWKIEEGEKALEVIEWVRLYGEQA